MNSLSVSPSHASFTASAVRSFRNEWVDDSSHFAEAFRDRWREGAREIRWEMVWRKIQELFCLRDDDPSTIRWLQGSTGLINTLILYPSCMYTSACHVVFLQILGRCVLINLCGLLKIDKGIFIHHWMHSKEWGRKHVIPVSLTSCYSLKHHERRQWDVRQIEFLVFHKHRCGLFLPPCM